MKPQIEYILFRCGTDGCPGVQSVRMLGGCAGIAIMENNHTAELRENSRPSVLELSSATGGHITQVAQHSDKPLASIAYDTHTYMLASIAQDTHT